MHIYNYNLVHDCELIFFYGVGFYNNNLLSLLLDFLMSSSSLFYAYKLIADAYV